MAEPIKEVAVTNRIISRNTLVVVAISVVALALLLLIPTQAQELPNDGRVNLLPWVNGWGAVAVYCVPPSGGPAKTLPGGGVTVLNQRGQLLMTVQQANINSCLDQLRSVSQISTACRDQLRARGAIDSACRQQIRNAGLENTASLNLAFLGNGVCVLRNSPPTPEPGVRRLLTPTPVPTQNGVLLTSIYYLIVFPNGAMQINSLPDAEGKTFVGKWQGCGG